MKTVRYEIKTQPNGKTQSIEDLNKIFEIDENKGFKVAVEFREEITEPELEETNEKE